MPVLCSGAAASGQGLTPDFRFWCGRVWIISGETVWGYFLRFLLSVPVAAYLFGLAYGGIVRKSTSHFHKDSASAVVMKLHAVPDVAVSTAVVAVCAAYLVFIGLQSSYLFSAFAGLRPENFYLCAICQAGIFRAVPDLIAEYRGIAGRQFFFQNGAQGKQSSPLAECTDVCADTSAGFSLPPARCCCIFLHMGLP